VHVQEWGAGDPLIALHPLALESTAFAGVAKRLEALGLRTLGVDLPGFGATPAPDDTALTPAILAEPVIELARSLERPPIVMGMSMGGRVALEVALAAPEAISGVVLVAPYLPWRTWRSAIGLARHMNPAWAEKLPLERAWPILRHSSDLLDALPALQNDWFARACVRVVYYSTCPATRVAFLSASRELALDPAFGEDGLWPRLSELKVPASFLWAGRDRLIPKSHADGVTEFLPHVPQLEVACSGHFVNFVHYRCMEHAMELAVREVLESDAQQGGGEDIRIAAPCLSRKRAESSEKASPRKRRRRPRVARAQGKAS
jgi:pimeloyl-ACP methyl ester carboxylesterase